MLAITWAINENAKKGGETVGQRDAASPREVTEGGIRSSNLGNG